jgi:hypothetical protein
MFLHVLGDLGPTEAGVVFCQARLSPLPHCALLCSYSVPSSVPMTLTGVVSPAPFNDPILHCGGEPSFERAHIAFVLLQAEQTLLGLEMLIRRPQLEHTCKCVNGKLFFYPVPNKDWIRHGMLVSTPPP